jgi:hypothetical protein
MDLTPPSLSTSPALSEQKFRRPSPCAADNSFSLEASAASYPSPTILDFTYRTASPYESVEASSIIDSIEVDSSQSHLDCMAQAAWTPPDAMGSSTSATPAANLPSILPLEYDPFGTYQPCFTASYPLNESFPPPSSAASTLTHSPAPSVDASSSRNSMSVGPAGALSYMSDPTAPRVKIEGPNSYNSSLDSVHYAVAPSIQATYQSYLAGQASSFSSATVQTTAATQSTQQKTTKTTLAAPKTRRPTRKHTTREEANFQCQVQGCGKFFSRSYNFKSHMETHDAKREYHFPCQIEDCKKKFVRKTDLQRHHQSVHMKERNHGCDYCGRLFARKDTLRR